MRPELPPARVPSPGGPGTSLLLLGLPHHPVTSLRVSAGLRTWGAPAGRALLTPGSF